MSEAYASELRSAGDDPIGRVASGILGIAIVAFLLSVTVVLQWTTPQWEMGGVGLFVVLGSGLVVGGVGSVLFGMASWVGVVETTPDDRSGTGTGVLMGVLVGVVVALFCSQTLHWEGLEWLSVGGGDVPIGVPAGWVVVALPVGVVVGGWTAVVREDLGSTIVPGLLVAVGGLLVVTGEIGVGWQWNLNDVSAVIHGAQAVPFMTIFLSLLLMWVAGQARVGFGARGRQQAAYLLLTVIAFGMMGVLVLIVAYITIRGAGRAFQGVHIGLDGVAWPFVTHGSTFGPGTPDGVYPSIVGTVWLVIGSVSFAVPLGVGAAVFLTEYAEQGRFTQVVEVATNALWSTPSIVFGLFGYALLVPRIGNRNTLLSGMLVLGFMLLPLVIITSRESLKAVPDEYRDASAALGVSQWKTIRSVVLPAAMPGVITGIILGVGRIAGETAPLILVMAGGLNQDSGSLFSPDLLQGAQALPYKLYAIITAGIEAGSEFGWATAFILLLVVLTFYAIGIGSRIYFRRKLNE